MKPKRTRKVYYTHSVYEDDPLPMIRISGKFLERLGFWIGDAIEMEYEPNRITISKKVCGEQA